MKNECEHIWLDTPDGKLLCRDCGLVRDTFDPILYRRTMTREGYAYEPVNIMKSHIAYCNVCKVYIDADTGERTK